MLVSCCLCLGLFLPEVIQWVFFLYQGRILYVTTLDIQTTRGFSGFKACFGRSSNDILRGDIWERKSQWYILQGTNKSPRNGILKMIFLFPKWDILISWRVSFLLHPQFVVSLWWEWKNHQLHCFMSSRSLIAHHGKSHRDYFRTQPFMYNMLTYI